LFHRVEGVSGLSGENTIVVVEDDASIADLLCFHLRRDGFRVLLAASGERGLAAIRDHRPDAVILDIGLPGIDGLEVCRQVRAFDDAIPVIFLTARTDEVDRILGLDLGADDYVTKPFSPREMVARVKARLRRPGGVGSPSQSAVEVGSVLIRFDRRDVSVDGSTIPLTKQEFDLLQYLCENRGVALTRRQILEAAWGHDWVGEERTVDAHVSQLRRKIGNELPLATVWGVGYRLG